ncbi:hypothetical protein GEV33_003171 [Tenebrio molitor]|uniref:SBSPON-like C-terminal domain-containing protein n=1 Tax=Tenebrio molitor TaxID=7067 RepID=A0A8J6LF16_TENMO|nr:hypothetical protein GEV33_005240 [Tenebrio molitor]KAH0819620.1 hypothetical protein GEV33_003171 [Tenebrio molitor]
MPALKSRRGRRLLKYEPPLDRHRYHRSPAGVATRPRSKTRRSLIMRSGGGIKWAVKMSGGVGVAPQRGYCVEFEILKASKACRKESNYDGLKEGERVCVRCESEALHQSLGWRCQGHGVQGRITRFSALSAPHCHGKWLRAQAEVDRACTSTTCKAESAFIFV